MEGRRNLVVVVVEGGCRRGRWRGVRWWELLRKRERMGGLGWYCMRMGRGCRL